MSATVAERLAALEEEFTALYAEIIQFCGFLDRHLDQCPDEVLRPVLEALVVRIRALGRIEAELGGGER